ncbi:salicylic acid-binding protein 2-like [Actinidia eriantha]|uniref:salicylic acid-binding protein 2-like n=1 Tax=Actinidia eriantha TaxID=165200 RepID=UPI00258A5053|nr:salicylic acid-binding protein 2-like [Actinidia eriantha]
MEGTKKQNHFVLVHGACHGAWTWYKLKPLLEAAGHRVTALDLAASGVNLKKIHDLRTLRDYSEPLMETMASLGPGEKVVLVGHSLGGMNLALAMDKYPEKISVAVYVTAFMPDIVHKRSYILEEFVKRTPNELWRDTMFEPIGTTEKPLTSMLFGPEFMEANLYQLCPIQDLTLATTLMRPSSLFIEDLAKGNKFSDEGYGSVARAYVVCKDDNAITEEFQRWMIQNSPGVKEVVEINGADHMPMLSTPEQLCQTLIKIAGNHS